MRCVTSTNWTKRLFMSHGRDSKTFLGSVLTVGSHFGCRNKISSSVEFTTTKHMLDVALGGAMIKKNQEKIKKHRRHMS